MKIIIGLTTLLYMIFPAIFFLLWIFLVIPTYLGSSNMDELMMLYKNIILVTIPLGCFVLILMFGLLAFYVVHAIKNQDASDAIRLISVLAILFFPYIGMPFYYIVFIIMPNPPSWALKPESSSI